MAYIVKKGHRKGKEVRCSACGSKRMELSPVRCKACGHGRVTVR
jgi:DNA-directed RNA polymerase subunit RPC12/RpoP